MNLARSENLWKKNHAPDKSTLSREYIFFFLMKTENQWKEKSVVAGNGGTDVCVCVRVYHNDKTTRFFFFFAITIYSGNETGKRDFLSAT